MLGFSFTQNNIEYVIVLPSVTYTSGNKAVIGSQELEIYDSTVMASLETAIIAYQPGGSGGSYDEGYAAGETAMESEIASSQAITANLYKSKLASEDATIAAADSTDIEGQGTIFSESYSYLKTTAEMQANYNSGYTAGETAGYSAGETAGEATGYTNGQNAAASSQATVAGQYKTKLSSDDAVIAAADATTLAGQGTIFSESYSYLKTSAEMQANYTDGYNAGYSAGSAASSGTPFTTSDFIHPFSFGGYGNYTWTDGTNIYYSNGSTQYVLDPATSLWSAKTWTGLTNFIGNNIWTDGSNIYCSPSNSNSTYILDVATSTWSAKVWTGFTNLDGSRIWTDGTDIYYSNGSAQYVLDVATSTWSAKTWSGYTNLDGEYIWSDGTNIYYSAGTNQYVLDIANSTWDSKTWNGLTSFNGINTWTDGSSIYFSSTSTQYVLDVATSTWTIKTWLEPYPLPNDVKLLSNGTVYEFNNIDMSFKPVSSNP